LKKYYLKVFFKKNLRNIFIFLNYASWQIISGLYFHVLQF